MRIGLDGLKGRSNRIRQRRRREIFVAGEIIFPKLRRSDIMEAVRKDYAAPTGLEFGLGCGSTKMPRLRHSGRSRTTKPRPARQSGSLSGNAQTSRRRLAMTRQAMGEVSMPMLIKILISLRHLRAFGRKPFLDNPNCAFFRTIAAYPEAAQHNSSYPRNYTHNYKHCEYTI